MGIIEKVGNVGFSAGKLAMNIPRQKIIIPSQIRPEEVVRLEYES